MSPWTNGWTLARHVWTAFAFAFELHSNHYWFLPQITRTNFSTSTTFAQAPYGNRKATRDFLCVANSNVCPVCHVWTSLCFRFECLTFKLKSTTSTIWIKIDSRTAHANVHVVSKKWRSYVQPCVRRMRSYISRQTHALTYWMIRYTVQRCWNGEKIYPLKKLEIDPNIVNHYNITHRNINRWD